MTGWALDRALTAVERLLLALIGLRAAILRRRWRLPAQDAAWRRCRSCGCVDTHACIEIASCRWAGSGDLCSACAGEELDRPAALDPVRDLEDRFGAR